MKLEMRCLKFQKLLTAVLCLMLLIIFSPAYAAEVSASVLPVSMISAGDGTITITLKNTNEPAEDGSGTAITDISITPSIPDVYFDTAGASIAPGESKSFSAAFAMEDQGEILACDLHENKLKRIREGAERLGLACIQTTAADGRGFRPEWEAAFDVVLVDAPCSGFGIIRKKPDVRYKKPDDLFALPVIQRAILDNAARYVRPGGTLVYSTCTVLPEENEDVTGDFLDQHPEFEPVRTVFPLPVGPCPGQVTLWPQRHGTDGFYICRMRRKD